MYGVLESCLFALVCIQIELQRNFKLYCLYFFSKFELPNRGCGLSTGAAYTWNFTVTYKIYTRIEKLAEKEAFITLKDHKPTFNDHPTCRLINPSKSEIGVISKQILDDINTAIINKTQINQWKNTSSVLKWFNGLQHKEALSFICFDVCDFYPSITEKLLCKTLDFANSYRPISAHERDIIIHAKRSLLFSDNIPWEKKASNDRFDVTMGSFDGAETCELVGCYILSLLTQKYGSNIGLYRVRGCLHSIKRPKRSRELRKTCANELFWSAAGLLWAQRVTVDFGFRRHVRMFS